MGLWDEDQARTLLPRPDLPCGLQRRLASAMRPTPSSGPSWSGDGVADPRGSSEHLSPPFRMAPRTGHASQGLQPVSRPPRSTDGSAGRFWSSGRAPHGSWGSARLPPAELNASLRTRPLEPQLDATISAMRTHRPVMDRICNIASVADDAYAKVSPLCDRQRPAYLPMNPSPIRLMHQRIGPLASAARQPRAASTMRSTNSATARLPLGTLCREQQLTE